MATSTIKQMAQLGQEPYFSELAALASSNVLVAFDYDGTLAPIVANPSRARMRSRTRRLLTAVAQRYPCVVISGRTRDDLARRLSRIPVWRLIGNHGLEPWEETPDRAARVQRWIAILRARLTSCEGVFVEDKTYSVAIHYRHARQPEPVLEVIQNAIAKLDGMRVMGGNHAVNLIPADAPHKGIALERARCLLACDTAIYVGDDETDELAFTESIPTQFLTIRIGQQAATAARYRLEDQRAIDSFLKTLVTLRPRRFGHAMVMATTFTTEDSQATKEI